MKIVTAEEMKQIDHVTTTKYGIAGHVLMERAGLAVAERIAELFGKTKVIVLCGGGNNGGDGLVAARVLFDRGWNVRALLFSKEGRLSPDCELQLRIARKAGVPVEFRNSLDRRDLHSAVVIDALFGTGLNKALSSPYSDVINVLNGSDCPVVAVDIPSGISADSGAVQGGAVYADYTVTFGLPKTGHFLYPGAEHTGKLFIEDIGFPALVLAPDRASTSTIDKENAALLLPHRYPDSYKGDYGHVLVVAGSRGKTGAAVMAARSCLRSGAGMVTIGVPESLLDVFQARVTEEMLLPLPDSGSGTLSSSAGPAVREFLNTRGDVLAIGPGLTEGDDIRRVIEELVLTSTVPAVFDTDAINVLSGNRDILKKAKAPIVLTPHTGEMARLLKGSAENPKEKIAADRIGAARAFAVETGVCLVLKGAPTIVAGPEGHAFLNTTGNPGMATAGSGDVLTGIIAGLLGQKLDPVAAAVLGVYLHGMGGDIAAAAKGTHALIAGDIIDHLPDAFLKLSR